MPRCALWLPTSPNTQGDCDLGRPCQERKGKERGKGEGGKGKGRIGWVGAGREERKKRERDGEGGREGRRSLGLDSH